MNVTSQEIFTQLNKESTSRIVRSETRECRNKPRQSFSTKLDSDIENYLRYQNEIDALIGTGEMESADDISQAEATTKETEKKRAYPTSPLRLGVIKSIVSQPYKLMLTVASPTPLSDQAQFNDIDFLLRKLNGHYFGRSWSKHRRKGLIGHVAAEPHTFSNHLRGSLNFHILLTQPPEIADIDDFRSQVLKYVPHVKGWDGEPALDMSMVDVRPVWQDRDGDAKKGLLGLAQYVTKSMEHPVFKNGEYQMPLTPAGIQGIPMRNWRDIAKY